MSIPERRISLGWAFRLVLPTMYFSLIFDLIAGVFLGINFEKIMISYPALFIVIPGLMGLRGNIFGSLGSRVSTALYLGSAQPSLKDDYVVKNVVFSVWGATIPALILLAVAFAKFRDVSQIASVFQVVLNSSVLISLILGILTVLIVILSFRKGVDPDSIVGPAITTFADMVSIPSLILFILIVESFKYSLLITSFSAVILLLSFVYSMRCGERKAYREVIVIVSLLALIQSITGNILEEFSQDIHRAIILSFAYPAVLGSVGNYGSIVVARTSTKLHLGELEKMSMEVIKDSIYIFTTSFLIFPLIIFVSVLLSSYFGFTGEIGVFFISSFFVVYLTIVFLVLLLSNLLSVLLYKKGVDPDNGGIPLITTLSDVISTIAVVAVAKLSLIA